MRNFFLLLTRNAVTMAGAAVTTASAAVFATLFAIDLLRTHESPYIGILTYLIVPAVFVLGLLLVPAGLLLERWRMRRLAKTGLQKEGAAFPVIDFNRDRTRAVAIVFVGLTTANAVIFATATYKGVEVLESTRFCGATCHTVMEPEYVAYRRSPHAQVPCVDCHAGPGAGGFVRSKLAGTRQVMEVLLNSYPRPIPASDRSVGQARQMCAQCHSRERFSGDRLRVISHRSDDEASSPLKTVLLLHVGGSRGGVFEGAHWHADPSHRIRYRTDPAQEGITEVELTLPDGATRRYVASDGAGVPAADNATPAAPENARSGWQTMDCVDCHNRPAHVSRTPESEVDEAIDTAVIDVGLPFVRREAVRLLQGTYRDRAQAAQEIGDQLRSFYGKEHPEVARAKEAAIRQAGIALGEIYARNVFPKMRVTWSTYPSQLGHTNAPGCFRCHDGGHTSSDGRTISQDCGLCHSVLAMDEADPKILQALRD